MKDGKSLRVLLCLLAALAMAAPAFSGGQKKVPAAEKAEVQEKPIILRLGNVVPPTSSKNLACLKFAELVQNRTKNKIQIQVFPASQLGTEPQLAQSVQINALDIYWGDAGSFDSFVPELAVWNAPMLFKDDRHWDAVVWGPIFDKMADNLLQKAGLRTIGRMWMGNRYVLTVKKPVNNVVDLTGLKIRVPEIPMFVAAFKALGATPTPIAYADVYMALQQGVVDGMENPIDLIRAMKFYEVCKYLTAVSWANAVNVLIVNEAVFQRLTPEQKEIIVQAGKESGLYLSELLTKERTENVDFFKSKGMTIIAPEDIQPWLNKLADFPEKNANLWGGNPDLYRQIQRYTY